jgi:hypothetical protein
VNNDRNSLFEIEALEIIRSTVNRHIVRNQAIENPRCPNESEIYQTLIENPEKWKQFLRDMKADNA